MKKCKVCYKRPRKYGDFCDLCFRRINNREAREELREEKRMEKRENEHD